MIVGLRCTHLGNKPKGGWDQKLHINYNHSASEEWEENTQLLSLWVFSFNNQMKQNLIYPWDSCSVIFKFYLIFEIKI